MVTCQIVLAARESDYHTLSGVCQGSWGSSIVREDDPVQGSLHPSEM